MKRAIAREELANARRDRDEVTNDLRISRNRLATAEKIMDEDSRKLAAAREELAKTRAELDDAQARINRTLAALTNPMWRGLLDDDVAKLVDETGALLRADANPATTAEHAACTCATWREETPFGPQAVTGPDATCPVHGEKAEPAAS